MTPTTSIETYINLGLAITSAGGQLIGKLKGVLDLIRPDHGLTDEQINELEQQTIAEAQKRLAERQSMARPTDPAASGQ